MEGSVAELVQIHPLPPETQKEYIMEKLDRDGVIEDMNTVAIECGEPYPVCRRTPIGLLTRADMARKSARNLLEITHSCIREAYEKGRSEKQ